MAPAPDSNRAEALKALSAEEANFIMYDYEASVLRGGPEHASTSTSFKREHVQSR